jgi:hypothetical protein
VTHCRAQVRAVVRYTGYVWPTTGYSFVPLWTPLLTWDVLGTCDLGQGIFSRCCERPCWREISWVRVTEDRAQFRVVVNTVIDVKCIGYVWLRTGYIFALLWTPLLMWDLLGTCDRGLDPVSCCCEHRYWREISWERVTEDRTQFRAVVNTVIDVRSVGYVWPRTGPSFVLLWTPLLTWYLLGTCDRGQGPVSCCCEHRYWREISWERVTEDRAQFHAVVNTVIDVRIWWKTETSWPA